MPGRKKPPQDHKRSQQDHRQSPQENKSSPPDRGKSQPGGNNISDGRSDLELGWIYRNAAEGPGRPSADVIAKQYGVSPGTVRRKIRLTFIVPQLYDLALKLNCSQSMLLDLSYLSPVQQINVAQAVIIEGLSLTPPLASVLRAQSEKAELTIDEILDLCRKFSPEQQTSETAASSPGPTSSGQKKYAVDDALFPPGLPLRLREQYITAALRSFRKSFPPEY